MKIHSKGMKTLLIIYGNVSHSVFYSSLGLSLDSLFLLSLKSSDACMKIKYCGLELQK